MLKPALSKLRKGQRPAGARGKPGGVGKTPGAWRNKLNAKDRASYDKLQNAMNASAGRSASQIRSGLSNTQIQNGQKHPWLRSMYVGTEIEKDTARRVARDTNISHLGASNPGKAVPDFQIGGKHNVDITGGSASSTRTHMNRPYYHHPDQILSYPTIPKTKLEDIFR
ncbi:hypothetical protein BS329_09745 [Amycolatopsis coloradensis]|uniref:Uncharacterized protein n=1 Tax=Amycolatopsis coloradensis TaxID=76021 RepID=A0A1R0KVQ6_9PSEU|nr:hypothetical protein BS329_09745 [Amycolatopsis coloradensis]